MNRTALQIVSWIALVGSILPSLLFLAGRMTLDDSKWWLLIATIVWFVATPIWMDRKHEPQDGAVQI